MLVVLGLAVLLVIGAWASLALTGEPAEAECRGPAHDLRLTAPSAIGTIPLADEQVANADTIVRTAMATGRSPSTAALAVTTAMQESALLNLGHGDEAGPDSRGLFQQRLQFYADVDVMDPASATRAFLDRLEAVPGWADMAPADAIQAVQRSAHPELYSAWIDSATGWVDALWGYAESCGASSAASAASDASDA